MNKQNKKSNKKKAKINLKSDNKIESKNKLKNKLKNNSKKRKGGKFKLQLRSKSNSISSSVSSEIEFEQIYPVVKPIYNLQKKFLEAELNLQQESKIEEESNSKQLKENSKLKNSKQLKQSAKLKQSTKLNEKSKLKNSKQLKQSAKLNEKSKLKEKSNSKQLKENPKLKNSKQLKQSAKLKQSTKLNQLTKLKQSTKLKSKDSKEIEIFGDKFQEKEIKKINPFPDYQELSKKLEEINLKIEESKELFGDNGKYISMLSDLFEDTKITKRFEITPVSDFQSLRKSFRKSFDELMTHQDFVIVKLEEEKELNSKAKAKSNKFVYPPVISRKYCEENGLCKNFFLKSYCADLNCELKHPKQFQRCPNLDKPEGCTNKNCKYNHPNPLNSDHLIHLTDKLLKLELIPKIKFRTVNHGIQKKECETWKHMGICYNLNCPYEHRERANQDSNKFKDYESSSKNFTLREPTKTENFMVMNLWDIQSDYKTSRKIKSIKIIENSYLYSRHSFIIEDAQRKQIFEGLLWGFHGTSKDAVDGICRNGFLENKQLRNLYGKGTYFARSPDVSIGYCDDSHNIFLCRLCMTKDGYIYNENLQYYIIPDVKKLRPYALIKFF